MSRYAKQGISEEDLQNKIEDIGGPYEVFTNVQSVINIIQVILQYQEKIIKLKYVVNVV